MGTEILGRADEELLLRFLDGESGFLESRRARRLIAASQAAREFAASVDGVGKCAVAWHSELIRENRMEKIDLWDRISKRIEDEERVSLFHGQRVPVAIEPRRVGAFAALGAFVDQHILMGRAAWGLGGAAIAAALTFFMVAPQPQQTVFNKTVLNNGADSLGVPRITGRSVDLRLGSEEAEFVVPASMQRQLEQVYMKRAKRRAMVDSEKVARAQEEFESPFGIEWMRSDGHVTLIQDAKRGSTIIWVNPEGQERRHRTQNSNIPVIIERDSNVVRPTFK